MRVFTCRIYKSGRHAPGIVPGGQLAPTSINLQVTVVNLQIVVCKYSLSSIRNYGPCRALCVAIDDGGMLDLVPT